MRLDYWKAALLGCSFVATVSVCGCQHEEAGSGGPERPAAGVTQPIRHPVVEYAYFTGQTHAIETVNVRARVTGYLQKICYQPGKIVARDELLFEIDPASYRDQLAMAKARVAQAEGQVEEAKAKVTQTEAQVEFDRSKLARDIEVAKTPGAVSQQQLDVSQTAVKSSQATLLANKATVLALEASVRAAEANVAINQQNLDWTKVKAPIGGRVDRNLLTVGNLVTADTTTLTNIVATDAVYVYFDVDELKFLDVRKKIREGAYAGEPERVPIAVALQNEQGYPHPGETDLVANALSVGTGTMQLRAVLKNPQGVLTPGNFVRIRVPLDKPRDKLLVPDRAVIYEQGDTFLLIVDREDKVDKRKVAIGPLDPDDKSLRVIEEGVKADERVIIQGRQRARPGALVKPEEAPPPEKPVAPPEGPPAKT